MVSIWLIVVTVVLCAIFYYLFISPMLDNIFQAVASEPKVAPSYIPFFGFLFKFMSDPYEFARSLHDRYGARIVVNIMNRRHIFLNDQPTFANRVAKDPLFTLDFLDDQFHNGGGVRWECIRNEEAKNAIIKQYHEYLYGHELSVLNHKTCQYLMKRLAENEHSVSPITVNIFDYIAEMMFDTAVNVLYGETFARSQRDFFASFKSYKSVVGTMMIEVPFKSFFLRSAIRQRDQFIERFIGLKPNEDMSKLLLARIELMDSFGDVFNEHDKAGMHAVFLWISLINTLPTACWSIVDLLLHPEAMKTVKEELTAKVTNTSSLYEKEILAELVVMESSMQETMRRVILMLLQRQASQSTVVTCMDGTQMGVRKGDIIVCPDIVKQFDPKMFENPYEYRLDRSNKQFKSSPIMWFGAGNRICPGRYWAVNEIKLLLALVLLKLDIVLLMDADYQEKTRARIETQIDSFLIDLGPHEKDKHQFRIQYSVKI